MKHLVFIGRWSPLHKGHKHIIRKIHEEKKLPVLILVRDSVESLPIRRRICIIKTWLNEVGIPGTVMRIPDVEGVYYGRGVGYNIQEVSVSPDMAVVSGTDVREALTEGDYKTIHEGVDDQYTLEEEELIKRRLRKLGYIE